MIVALDIATKCGWAVSTGRSGVEDFSSYDDYGEMAIRFERWIKCEFHAATQFVMERPHGFGSRVYTVNGLLFIAHKVAREMGVPRTEVNASSWRKEVLGSGRAKKVDAIKWCQDQGIKVIDDNHAEALCILEWAKRSLAAASGEGRAA